MKKLKNLTLSLAVCTAGVAVAAAPNAPDILVPNETNASVIKGMSDNGKYGVASSKPGEDGFSYYIGAHFYDLTGSIPKVTNLAKNSSAADAMDVTDDGMLVVGSVNHQPAVCRNVNGTWTWEQLPVPNITYEVEMEDMYSGKVTVQKFKLNGGQINAVTPDGRYGVGLCRSNENINVEKAVMWDLQNKQIVEVDSPETCLFGHDNDYNTRYQQISADGRYILCCNVFIYPDETVYFVYDRQEKKPIYIDYRLTAGGNLTKRDRSVNSIELDGISKSLTSDGRYVTGRAVKQDSSYAFIFDVKNEEFKVLDDGIHGDVWGWTVTKDGLVLGGTPADTPYADALVCTPDYFFTFESLFRDVYGLNMRQYGIDNTGKPTLVSDDGKTVVFVTEPDKSYVARFQEPISDAVDRINLMSSWTPNPKAGSAMAKFTGLSLTFENPIEFDASKSADIKFTDSKGTVSVSPKADGINVNGVRLTLDFNTVDLAEGETYTLTVPAGFCWVKGHPNSINDEIKVSYKGRANVPVAVKSITPESGTTLATLDLNDNPVVVTFDAPVKINGTADSRPTAQLFVDGGEEPAATLAMDIDLNSNNLVIYPTSTIYLYKGSEYTLKVPEGAVTDISGAGPSKAFEVTYTGSFVPQLGDEKYVFKSTCDDFTNFLFYEGDYGTPVSEYANMGFTHDTTPWWVVMDDELTADMAFASHSAYVDGRAANDWVATRQLAMPEDVPAYLTFQGQSYRKNKTDRLKVYIYENEQSLAQLDSKLTKEIVEKGDLVFNEVLSPGANEGIMAGEWTDYVIDLTPYKGKKIYICFVNDNQNQSMVMVDNIFVVKNINAFVSIKSHTNVVNQSSAPVSGVISVESELVNYKNLSMSLLDSNGKEVSTLKDNVSLTAGDTYDFTFPQELPLTVGEENHYTIVYTLDNDEMKYEGIIRNLAFNVEKRVVVEEQTGKDCQFCPLGIAAMERLESLYGNKVIPVALHVYSGSDPKGANVMGYASAVFMGSGTAPTGRINRRPNITAPMISDDAGRYHMTSAEVPGGGLTWQDEIVDELAEPSYLDVVLTPQVSAQPNEVTYNVTVKSAINLEDMNIRLLGVLLEDNLLDSQKNGVFNNSDPLLGEFGNGGIYGKASFYYYFNNVARGYWGQSTSGTPRLFPTTLEVGKEYSTELTYVLPGIVQDVNNIKMVVMLIDESTGRVINAAVQSADVTGVDEIVDEGAASLDINKVGSEIVVSAAGDVQVAVYAADGRMLKSVNGNGTVSFSIEGYKGVAIIRAASNGQSVSKKVML